MNKRSTCLVIAASLSALSLHAAIVPFAPADGSVVTLLPEVQRNLMALPTYKQRLETLKEDAAGAQTLKKSHEWQRSNPLILRWKCTDGEKGPWLIKIRDKDNPAAIRDYWLTANDGAIAERVEDGKPAFKFTVPKPNLELGHTYYWKVWSNVDRKEGQRPESAAASFKTDPQAPRWIALDSWGGAVGNFRDLGGRMTASGQKVRQGMVYRSQGLNFNSVNGQVPGRNRMTVEDVKYLTQTLGIKTDLDLRGGPEIATMKESPLGPSVKWINHPSPCYKAIFEPEGMKITAENFRVFCDPKNYPIIVHCIGGADRTGSICYILNGVLGVDRHELETDWEETFYPRLPELWENYTGPNFWCGEHYFDEGFAKYGSSNSTWAERIELYLKACGITQEELDSFKSIMLK